MKATWGELWLTLREGLWLLHYWPLTSRNDAPSDAPDDDAPLNEEALVLNESGLSEGARVAISGAERCLVTPFTNCDD